MDISNVASAPNAKLFVSSSSTLQKKRKFEEDDHNNRQQGDQEEVLKQPGLGGSSSSCDDDVIEHSFNSSSSHPTTASNTLRQFSTSPTSLPPQTTPPVPSNHPNLSSKSKLTLTVSPPIHSEIPPNSQQITNYTHYSRVRVPGCRCKLCLHHSTCTLAQMPLNRFYLSELSNLSSINPGL